MNITTVNINDIKENPDNPRHIKDHNFKKLVKSIKAFPQMLDIRPIVVDEDNIVLGGNMRLKACKDAGLKEIPIIKASELTDEQKKEFILKDNASYGEWNYDMLKDFGKDLLLESGFEDYDLNGIFGENHLEDKFKGNIEGSNFDATVVNVDDYIKQNILFFNEKMIEFQDDEIKEAIRNIGDTTYFLEDLKKLILQYGKNSI